MAGVRTKYQGVSNIIRFNWHFFAFGLLACIGFVALYFSINDSWNFYFLLVALAIFMSISISLLTSWYIYDKAGLYDLKWLKLKSKSNLRIANINAGFDETTLLLEELFPNAEIIPYDFYDENRHTEVSIKRARAAYPSPRNTENLDSKNPDLQKKSFNIILLFMSLHEIRDKEERVQFLKSISAGLSPNGEIIVVEHLRDWKNLLAYNIGFLHFHSLANWLSNFQDANLEVVHTENFTSFIRLFKLKRK